MNTTSENLTTADLAEAVRTREARPDREAAAEPLRAADDAVVGEGGEALAALFSPEAAQQFRSRWDAAQIGFVDDPMAAVRQADELVAQVIKDLMDTFSKERANLEGQIGGAGNAASTEDLRLALRHYRSFFQRLLAL